MMGSAKSAGH